MSTTDIFGNTGGTEDFLNPDTFGAKEEFTVLGKVPRPLMTIRHLFTNDTDLSELFEEKVSYPLKGVSNILRNCCSSLVVPADNMGSATSSTNTTLCDIANYFRKCGVKGLSKVSKACPDSMLEQPSAFWFPNCDVANFLSEARNASCAYLKNLVNFMRTGIATCFTLTAAQGMNDTLVGQGMNGTFGEPVTNDTFFELEISTTGAIGFLGPEISTTALVGMIAAGIGIVTVGLGVGAYCVSKAGQLSRYHRAAELENGSNSGGKVADPLI